jgi:signal transduction histidine kinase/ActR/RegA family two-component response regulator
MILPGGPAFKLSPYRFLILLSLLVPALLWAGAAWLSYVEVSKQGQAAVERTTKILNQHAKRVFDTAEVILDFADYRVRNLDWSQVDEQGISDFLAILKSRFEQVVSIWVADQNGVVHAGSQEWNHQQTIANRDFFQAQREKDAGTYISPAFTGKATGETSFAISRRLYAADGSFRGTVHVSLSPQYFSDFFQQAQPSIGGAASLIRADGALIARYPATASSAVASDSPFFAAIKQNPDFGLLAGRSSFDGKDRIFAYEKVEQFPVYVVYAVETAALLAEWYRDLILFSAVFGGVALVLCAVSMLTLKRAKSEQHALFQLQHEVEQREAAEEGLRRAQRLEAIGQITGGVAHDFNNLLMIILGNLDRLRREQLSDRAERYVAAIDTASKRGEKLTRHLLTFSRKQSISPVVLDLKEALRNIPDLLRSSLRGDISIHSSADPALWNVKVDAAELELALINLAVNARDAMPEGGTIKISARNVSAPKEMVALEFSDSGQGMPDDVLRHAFEPFYTTKEVGKGTGLGLSQVYGFAAQAGGRASIHSLPGQGTTVTLLLPRATEALGHRYKEPADAPKLSGKILFAEDNKEVAETTIGNLEAAGLSVVCVPDGAAALACLRSDESFDYVVSDVVMPGGADGFEVAREARERYPSMPIVLVTGYTGGPDRLDDRSVVLLAKPFNQQQLLSALHQAKALVGQASLAPAS